VLESQLKIAKESGGLQEAEFAFQKSEYQAEIDHLQNREKELLQEIARLQTEKVTSQNVNVDVQVGHGKPDPVDAERSIIELRNEMEALVKENLALKAECESTKKRLQATDTDSARKTEDLAQITDDFQRQRTEFLKQLSEAKGTIKALRHDLKTATNAHATDKADYEAKLGHAQNKIEKQKAKLSELHGDHASLASASEEAASHLKLLESRFAESRSQSKLLRKELRATQERLRAAEEFLAQQKEILAMAELAHENLSDLLGIELDDNDSKWDQITEKVAALVSENETLHELQFEKDKLQKRLAAALEDRRVKLESQSGSEAGNGKSRRVSELDQIRKELEQKTKLIAGLAFRRKITQLLDKFMVSISREIFDLHSSVCGFNSAPFRPIVLAIVFVMRIRSSRPVDTSFRSLDLFAGRSIHSPSLRLKAVREKFTALTQQLLTAKQNVVELTANMANVIEERDIAQLTLRSNSHEVKIYRKKIALTKQRMNELQTELASLVSPEIYNEVTQALDQTKEKVIELEGKIDALQHEIETRNVLERNLRADNEQLEATTENHEEAIQEMRNQLTSRAEEVEELKALIREKTREILALERLVARQKETESSTVLTVNSLAVENHELQIADATVWRGKPEVDSPPPAINPAFLGQ
jgi:DNA repair exonuclease SbcCD ATPase subunit